MKRQRVVILGSTGSIGRSALEVLAPMREEYNVVGLAGGSRWERLAAQAMEYHPEVLAMTDATAGKRLATEMGRRFRVLTGHDAMYQLVDLCDFDCVIVGVVGSIVLPATVRAVERGKRLAIANKECMVVAGSILAPLATETGAEIIPVDSEHSAVFQAMHAGRTCDVRRVILTASGGPFRTWSREQMSAATLEDALRHPTWQMGPKITIDSATMMNKALEIVEARWLFGLAHDQIDVVVHPESIVHSMVEFYDGSVMAQLGTPDMRTPIQYALTYPARLKCPSARLDLTAARTLHFEAPDAERFPALRLGHLVAERGGTAGAVVNAANESAVQLFRDGLIRFSEIVPSVEGVLERHEFVGEPGLEDLMRADAWAREEVLRCTAC
ncbi:MAG: 1-deoxy-D-xylulose-5-phosphate reductoisomerase [Phycisphaerales bacterium]|nr:1-deoxy-D-xylulose-5-phosphate reductoisomerase [Phycisphaerales bacterium]